MRGLLAKSLASGALLLIGLAAQAQVYGPYRDDDRYDRDDRGHRRERPPYRGGDSLFQRVQSDLNFAESSAYSHGARKRIENARKELWEFQRAWNAGRFNRHDLDDSIGAMQKVVDHNALDGRARSILWDDLQKLRAFRANYYPRGYPRY
jgi:hypothetical protein